MKRFSLTLLETFAVLMCFTLFTSTQVQSQASAKLASNINRQRISINEGWRFYRYDSSAKADNFIYDIRPDVSDYKENRVADSKPTEAVKVEVTKEVLKPWILPTGNDFIKDTQKRHIRPAGNPGSNFQFVKSNFDDSSWEKVNLPHDWAIKGPFLTGRKEKVGGGMGRLPSK